MIQAGGNKVRRMLGDQVRQHHAFGAETVGVDRRAVRLSRLQGFAQPCCVSGPIRRTNVFRQAAEGARFALITG